MDSLIVKLSVKSIKLSVIEGCPYLSRIPSGTVVTQVRWFESVIEILTQYLLINSHKKGITP